MRFVKGSDRDQITMLPMCIDDFVADDNPVRVIDAFVDSLDLKALGFQRATPASTGRPAFDPRDLLKLYCYGYMNQIRSSRKLEEETYRNVEVMWLLRNLKPDHKTIADFRKDNKVAITDVFCQFSLLCNEWGLFGGKLLAVDGTKIRASNSKRKNFGEKKLKRQLKYIDEKVEEYMKHLEDGDEADPDIPKLSKEEIQKRIDELKARRTVYAELQQQMKDQGVTEVSLSDPDARLMSVNNNGVDVCFNVQTAVDSQHSLVVACDVINNPTDHGQLSAMGITAMKIMGVDEIEALADKGYYSAEDLKACAEAEITTYVPHQAQANATGCKEYYADQFHYNKEDDTYTCPQGHKLHPKRTRKTGKDGNTVSRDYRNIHACRQCPVKAQCTRAKDGRTVTRSEDQAFLDEVDRRTKISKEKYKLRQLIVEHPFGTIKRSFGFTYFLTRGLEAVKAEASLSFLAYNLMRAIKILGIKEIMAKLTSKGLGMLSFVKFSRHTKPLKSQTTTRYAFN